MNKHLPLALLLALTACSTLTPSSKPSSSQSTQAAANPTWQAAWGGVNKSYDTSLFALRDAVMPSFKQLTFTDPATGVKLAYNLYTPKNLDPKKRYPLVLFMADASTAGKGVLAPLTQGIGGLIWASDASQKEHPAFVLVPSYSEVAVNDHWQTSPEVAATLALLDDVVKRYPIDEKRLYTTGQSVGGMMSFYFNATKPKRFAASLYVGSQWDTKVLSPLLQQKFTYLVAAGDEKASAGMNNLKNLFTQNHTAFAQTHFSAKAPEHAQNAAMKTLYEQKNNHNFVQFDQGSVLPVGIDAGRGGEHMYSFDKAYKIKAVRDWLFAQHQD